MVIGGIVFAISATIFFGVLAIWYSIKKNRLENEAKSHGDEDIYYRYEVAVLREIEKRIGYSLDVAQVIDALTGNLPMFIPYSAIAALLVKNGKLLFSAHLTEPVNRRFLEDLELRMRLSFQELEGIPQGVKTDERITGTLPDDTRKISLQSYFHVPIIVNGDARALLTVASTQENAYAEPDILTVYRIAHAASETLSRLERLLIVEKGKLSGMISSLADGAFMVDKDSNLTVINDAGKHLLNIQKNQPTILDVLSSLPNSYDFNGKIQRVINESTSIIEKSVTIDDKIIDVYITPVLDENHGNEEMVLGASVVLHDVTVQKSVDQMKEDFTNIMVHELRSPLTSIKASTQLLTSDVKLTDEEKNKLLKLISEQANRLLDEVSAILDAAKLQAGLFTVQKIPADLKKIVEEKAAAFSAQAQQKLIKLDVSVDLDIPTFNFDAHHIGQVVTNLLSNSFKFTPSGGTIRVIAKREGNADVKVSVSDTGMGIPKDKQHLLFSKFSQVSTPSPQVGTGLGLYIVKGVIEAHGGTIGIESEEEKGTTISFTLPIQGTVQKDSQTQKSTYRSFTSENHLSN